MSCNARAQQFMRFYARSQFWSHWNILFCLWTQERKHDNKILPVRGIVVYLCRWCLVMMITHAYTSTRMIKVELFARAYDESLQNKTTFCFNINVITHIFPLRLSFDLAGFQNGNQTWNVCRYPDLQLRSCIEIFFAI